VWNGTTTRVMVATSPVNYGYHAGITGDNTWWFLYEPQSKYQTFEW
jgi:hypothetical protein